MTYPRRIRALSFSSSTEIQQESEHLVLCEFRDAKNNFSLGRRLRYAHVYFDERTSFGLQLILMQRARLAHEGRVNKKLYITGLVFTRARARCSEYGRCV